MSLKSDLFDALRALVSNRVYPDTFPQVPTPIWPAIRYSMISGTSTIDICGDGSEATDDVRVQIDCVALTVAERDSLRTAIRTAMALFVPPARIEGPAREDYDPDTKTYLASQDFVIYGSSI